MIHLVVPLKSGGVYDFACRLQGAIGEDVALLVPLSKDNIKEWKIGKKDSVFLQLSGYGFAKRGAPLWLLYEIERRRKDINSLGIFFHEIYAFGPVWSSSFWLSPVQRYIASRLAETSDFWMTSREASAKWLQKYADDKPNAVLPVFSTVGELDASLSRKSLKVVVFGSEGLRRMTYEMAGKDLFDWAEQQSLEIHDIGSTILDKKIAKILRDNQVIQHGQLESNMVCKYLADSQFGIVTYPVEYVAKSSVFGAYCSHGICPVLISKNYTQTDGLSSNVHYMPGIPKSFVNNDTIVEISRSARNWYQPHNLICHVESLFNLLRQCDS